MLTPYQAKVAAMLGLADPTWPENERAATRSTICRHCLPVSVGASPSRLIPPLPAPEFADPRKAAIRVLPDVLSALWWQREAPQFDVVVPGVAKHEGELVLAPGAEPAKDAKLALRMAVAAGEFRSSHQPVYLG